MNIGYTRVSTDEQNLDLQRDALKKADCELIFEEQVSGTMIAAPNLNKHFHTFAKAIP